VASDAKELPVAAFETQHAWAEWLEANHGTAAGVWLKLGRKGSGVPSLSAAEALHVALCYGWIDGQAAPGDERHWLQRYTPRTRRSKWSQKNREAALRLIASGEMRPSGLAEVEAAQADGRWDHAYASPRNITVPEDFQALLEANTAALEFFRALDSRNRYAILYRIHDAKRPDTRLRRMAQFVDMLAAGEKIH
jgi:uncharacterized protein YdeI (YjbR/CyaY-like superfamily)